MCSCRSVALRVTDDEREQSEHASSLLNQKKQQQKLNKNIISLFFCPFCFSRSGPELESQWEGCEESGRSLVRPDGEERLGRR